MKNFTKPFKFNGAMLRYFFSLFFLLVCQAIFAQKVNQIDIGIFDSISTNNIIKVMWRPNYDISSAPLTNIQYTVKWPTGGPSITSVDYYYPYFIVTASPPVLDVDGYDYQVFGVVPGEVYVTIDEGQEVLISSFTYTGGACSCFEIIAEPPDEVTNGDLWFEIGGSNVTGIIYEGIAYEATEWNGTTNNNWTTGSNWTNGVPSECKDVSVPIVAAKGYPLVDGNGICHDLNIDDGAGITVSSIGTLTVNGTLVNNAGESGLLIKSDVSGTGSLISSTTGVDARVERYLTKKKWHFIGMPVESGVAGVFHLPSGHSDIYLKPHIEETNLFGDYIIPNSTPLELGRGYECWVGDTTYANNETAVFPGKLNAGDYVTNAVGGFYDLTKNGPGYNFICNPYPSALQGSINSWTKTNVDASIWVWQGTKEIMAGGGNYLTWNGATGSLTNGIIPSMQGFFVKANAASPSLTIPQSSRVHDSQLFYKDSGLSLNTLRLDVEGNGCSDAVFVCFSEQASDGYDCDHDVRKLFGVNEAPQLYTKIPGDILSINVLPVLENDRTIEMGFECEVPSSFTILATGMDGFEEDIDFFLEDLKTEIIQDLKENPIYNFTGGLGDNPDRFLLHFGNPSSLDENGFTPVKIYSYDDIIRILNSTQGIIYVSVCDILGRIIIEKQFNTSSLVQIKTNAERGYYIVKVQAGDYVAQKKVFLK